MPAAAGADCAAVGRRRRNGMGFYQSIQGMVLGCLGLGGATPCAAALSDAF